MTRLALDRLIYRDPERRALRALARRVKSLPAKHRPDDALQIVVDLARELTNGRYAALAVTDEHDRTEGFITAGLSRQQLARLATPPQGHGPLGSLRHDGKPVRYKNVQEHAKAFGFPSNHPEMQQLVGVALWVHGNVRGSLYVTDPQDGRDFNEDDELVLTTLAAHATKVIETEWY